MMFGYGGFGWIGMVFLLLFAIGAVIGLVWLAVSAIRRSDEGKAQTKSLNNHGHTPREIASTRYASGEISREEYQQILSDLGD